MMQDAGKFLDGLMNLDKEKITMPMVDAMQPYTSTPGFNPELVKSKSLAASGKLIPFFIIRHSRVKAYFRPEVE